MAAAAVGGGGLLVLILILILAALGGGGDTGTPQTPNPSMPATVVATPAGLPR